MKYIKLIIVAALLSCHTKQGTEKAITKKDTGSIAKIETVSADSKGLDKSETAIIESYVDSVHIGIKGKCKVELIKHSVYDDNYVIVKFYIKGKHTTNSPETWMNTNNYCYETNASMGLQPTIEDFNNDNLNDITFISGKAARGANEVRRLFIYDDQKQALLSIVNSQDYPNMRYNKELDCIDAFLVYGGCSTAFLHIQGDSLKQFANVELANGLTVSTFDKKGKEKIILRDRSYKFDYTRFVNFKPLKKYEDE